MKSSVLAVVVALVSCLAQSCTAVVSPDTSRLAGHGSGADAGAVVVEDGAVAVDAGAILDDGGADSVDGGATPCGPGLIECGASCVDASRDPAHCGGCGRACASTERCSAGTCACDPAGPSDCAPGCPVGTQDCGGSCVDLARDPRHCGACGDACAVDELCVSGGCQAFRSGRGCTSCPCGSCWGDFGQCCLHPVLDVVVCVDADSCP